MNIREATENDFDAIWPIFFEIVSAGETYAYPIETTKSESLNIWMQLPRKTYVVVEDNQIIGTLLY